MRNADCDIAWEIYERSYRGKDGVEVEEEGVAEGVAAARLRIVSDRAARDMGKAKGNYVTIYSDFPHGGSAEDLISLAKAAADEMENLASGFESALAVGIGNAGMICDSLGQKTAERVIATRQLSPKIQGLTEVSAFSAGVAGKTGVESGEVIDGLVRKIRPDILVLVDSLCAGSALRIGRTLQITDTGLAPGSGVGGKSARLSSDSFGIPVLGIGIPLMVYARSLVPDAGQTEELEGLVVTPREIDGLAARCAYVLSAALNFYFLKNSLSQQEILSFMREV